MRPGFWAFPPRSRFGWPVRAARRAGPGVIEKLAAWGRKGKLGARPIFRPFSLGRDLGSARKISGFSAAAPRNFRGVSFARPSPNREAAALPNAIQLKRLPACRKRGFLRGLEIRWRAMAAQGVRVLGLAPGICRPHGSLSTNERFPTAVPGAHVPRPNRLEAPKRSSWRRFRGRFSWFAWRLPLCAWIRAADVSCDFATAPSFGNGRRPVPRSEGFLSGLQVRGCDFLNASLRRSAVTCV